MSGSVQALLPMSQTHVSVWLLVSGSPDVCNSVVSPCSNSFVSQSGWRCPALCMSPIHLSPLVAFHCFPSLAVVSGSPGVSNLFAPLCSSSFVFQSRWLCPLQMSPIHFPKRVPLGFPNAFIQVSILVLDGASAFLRSCPPLSPIVSPHVCLC